MCERASTGAGATVAPGDDFRDGAADVATLVVVVVGGGGVDCGDADGDAFDDDRGGLRSRPRSFDSVAVVDSTQPLVSAVVSCVAAAAETLDGAVCARNAVRNEAGDGGSDGRANDENAVVDDDEEDEEDEDADGAMNTGSNDSPPLPPPSNDDVLSAGGRGSAADE